MQHNRKKEWFDDDSFWRDLYPFMFTEKRFEEAAAQIEQTLDLVKPAGKSVLDLCSGPGRCSIALAERGFAVTGVDITGFLMDKARERAALAGVEIEWVKSDMRDFVRPDSFDLAISMFTSFGYFENQHEDMIVLRNVLASLKPGGAFVIDTMGKERIARIFQPTVSSYLDGVRFVEVHEIIDDWTRIHNVWILIKDGKTQTFDFCHRIYSGQELRDRMEAAGFVDVKLYGDLDGTSLGVDYRRLVAVGHRPE